MQPDDDVPAFSNTVDEAQIRIDVRIDLHVHSRFSSRPYSWFLRSAHSAECYTEPAAVYRTAKARGMNLVTLCDHDTIDGALELRALADDTFISEEVSARFPEDGCIVHTIVIDITEEQHREIQALRGNIYDLVSYLHQQRVEFFLCHPLSQVNRRLQAGHLERCLLMFRNLELRNGTRDVSHERCLRQILDGLTPEVLAGFAERHPQTPVFNPDGRYGLVGGSDDHAGLSIARAFTTFAGELSGRGVTAALRARRTRPDGLHGTTAVLEHNVYGVIGGYIAHSQQLADAPAPAEGDAAPSPSPLAATLAKYAGILAEAVDEHDHDDHEPGAVTGSIALSTLASHGHTEATQKSLARVLESVLVKSGREAWTDLLRAIFEVRPAELADSIPAVVKSLLVAAPALLGARWHGADIQSARRYARELGFGDAGRAAPRVAVLTDTVDDVNGVAIGLRRLRDAAVANGDDLRLVSFGDGDHVFTDAAGVVRIPAVARHRLADYPEMEFGLPHLPSLLHYLVEHQIDLVQCSTPGPVGVVGFLAARLAGIPVVGQYHTDLPEYGTRITGDPVVGAILGKLCGWLYGAMDRVFVPSQAVAVRLGEMGVAPAKLARIPRGIDLDLFTPRRRDRRAFESWGMSDGQPKVLYVGRLSREKGLDALLDGFALAAAAVPDARLVIIGDGPYAARLAARAAESPRVTFLGRRTGDELARLMASSDLFVSPSETETFGNTVVEAQASGLPVIVAGEGAAHENMIEGITGLVIDGQSPDEIGGAIARMLGDVAVRRRMAEAASAFAQRYDMRRAAQGTFREYQRFLAEHAASAPRAARAGAAAIGNGLPTSVAARSTAAGRVA
jgi:glycosyltransferase involved in cell wall biosynthesis